MKLKNFLILFFLMILCTAQTSFADNLELRLLTGPAGGNWFNLGEKLASIWSSSGAVNIKTAVGGGVSNILNINAKRADIGFSVRSLFEAAVKGEADFSGRGVSNVMLMENLYRQYTYFIMRRDFADKYNIKSVDDIILKTPPMRFATLRPGTSSEFIVRALFEKGYGIDYKTEFRKWGGSVEFLSYEGGTELLLDHHLDCLAFSLGRTARQIINIENKLDIVILPVGQDVLEKLSRSYATEAVIIEPDIYKSLHEPVHTVGDYTCLVVRRDLPEELISGLRKSISEHINEVIADVE